MPDIYIYILADNSTGITVSTDQDTVASAGAPSGSITSASTSVTFAVAAGDRIAAKAGVPVTLTGNNAWRFVHSVTSSLRAYFFSH